MSACRGCGGVLGHNCWNEQDCMWIAEDMLRQGSRQEPEPCQGCHYVTSLMTACLGLCAGVRSAEDADARAALWTAIPTTFATTAPPAQEVPC